MVCLLTRVAEWRGCSIGVASIQVVVAHSHSGPLQECSQTQVSPRTHSTTPITHSTTTIYRPLLVHTLPHQSHTLPQPASNNFPDACRLDCRGYISIRSTAVMSADVQYSGAACPTNIVQYCSPSVECSHAQALCPIRLNGRIPRLPDGVCSLLATPLRLTASTSLAPSLPLPSV